MGQGEAAVLDPTGSDIGHFDVPDMAAMPEAYELVEDGLITRRFPWLPLPQRSAPMGHAQPVFFEDTRAAKQTAAVLAEAHIPTRAAAE
jgi:hypothetical protein